MMSRYFIFAGEASGDLHGSHLIEALRKEDSLAMIKGVGGPRMRGSSFECILPMENFQVMGFSDVLLTLPRLLKLFYHIRNQILNDNPDCIILIDYPGFNLRLAWSLRKKGYQGKIIQYICPTVWAHGKKRIETLNTHYNLLLTIYPFEKKFFTSTFLKVEYIGNPLVETIRNHVYEANWKTINGISENTKLIALFPGSRWGEILKHAPMQLEAAMLLKKNFPDLSFGLSCAHKDFQENLTTLASKYSFKLGKDLFIIPAHAHYDLMRNAHLALAKSGTVTLELALHSVPTVVHYTLSSFNYFIAKYFLRLQLPHYCIVNLLCEQSLFPEFIGKNYSSNDLAKACESILLGPAERERIVYTCENLKKILGTSSTHAHAAQIIQKMLKEESKC